MLSTLKNYQIKYLPNDIFAGIIIAAMSIPISMGYALVAGLPAVYGLYGSVFPIIVFAFISTSKQFIFGVDAAPCAIVGGFIATLGIESGSEQAIKTIPVITFFAACWLLFFGLLKWGRAVNYISVPVMGGFISGIAFSIILMQLPKLYGGNSGNGELLELVKNIVNTVPACNLPSLLIGLAALSLIIISKKFLPKFPMAVVVMFLGAACTYFFKIEEYGVQLLSSVDTGLPKLIMPSFGDVSITHCIGISLTVALVIMAETLLSENSFAMKNGYKINDNRELFAFSAGNFAGAMFGCCPINGSVSRTSMNDQFGGKTQLTSIAAGIFMILILLFATDFIAFLPIPVLTAIVISALLGVIEVGLAKRLHKVKRSEFIVFCAAFLGVVLLGTIYGVIIGVLLSFISVVIRTLNPNTDFLGIVSGTNMYYPLSRYKHAQEIEGVVIYRFSGDLFFANIRIFRSQIENRINDNTKVVIVDAGGVTSIDITAADYIELMYKNFDSQGIKFYITEHICEVNDQIRSLGLGYLIENGVVRRTITAALADSGYNDPFKLSGKLSQATLKRSTEAENSLEEFVWAFGDDAEYQMEKRAQLIVKKFADVTSEEEQIKIIQQADVWGGLGSIDEDDLINRLEYHLDEIAKALGKTEIEIEQALEERRHRIVQRLRIENPAAYEKLKKHRAEIEKRLKDENPAGYEHLQAVRKLKLSHARKRTERYERRLRLEKKSDTPEQEDS